MVWALNDADTDGPLERLVLLCLANEVSIDGIVRGPDWASIAAVCGVKVDSVERAVDRMRRSGLLADHDIGLALNAPEFRDVPARVASTGKARIRAGDRAYIYRRDGYACLRCGTGHDLTIDHVIPESMGGSSNPSNYQTLCGPCNSWKGTRSGIEFDYRKEVSA